MRVATSRQSCDVEERGQRKLSRHARSGFGYATAEHELRARTRCGNGGLEAWFAERTFVGP
eukprot:3571620-Prymnesium_polylepis.2